MVEFVELHKRLKVGQAQLNNELKQLDAEMHATGERREGNPFGKREEEANAVFEFERNVALEQQLTIALAEIQHAIEKYEAGNYGICDCCFQSIDPARLEALPQANLCLACKALQMRNAKNRLAR